MSTVAIDTSRTDERLSAFLSKIEKSEPVDNIFVETPLWDELWSRKEMIDGGRQVMFPVDLGVNNTIQNFSDYDTFNTAPQDTVKTSVAPIINVGGTVSISWEEKRETANSDVRVFDMISQKRKNGIGSLKDRMNADLFASSQVTGYIQPLPVLVTTSGTVQGIDSGSVTGWRSQEITSSGAFASTGLVNMRTLWNSCSRLTHGTPDITVTTQTIYEAFENELDVDVRYSDPKKLSRGAVTLVWKDKPFIFDADCPSGTLYMLNLKETKLKVDTDGAFKFDEFKTPYNAKSSTAIFCFRGQLVVYARRANGRITGIS